MDQEGNSTASFGTSSNMTSTETTNVAMVGQTVAGDTQSSLEESPAPSSDSALEMFPRQGQTGGVGQERSGEQSHPASVLPAIQDSGTENFGLSRSMLPQSPPEVPNRRGIYLCDDSEQAFKVRFPNFSLRKNGFR